jgi:AcrR family transcriptional regulator
VRISAEQKLEIMDRIVAIAERQLAENGLASVTLRTICDEAGIRNTNQFYNHFKGGMDEVILQVNSRTIRILDAILADTAKHCEGKSVTELFQRLALAYLHFAIDYPRRFAALFEHQMKDGEAIPEWHLHEHYGLFRHIETPLDGLNHDIGEEQRRTLARTIYSSVHGIVQLGLQGRMIALPVPVIEQQLRIITKVLATGLSAVADELSASAA